MGVYPMSDCHLNTDPIGFSVSLLAQTGNMSKWGWGETALQECENRSGTGDCQSVVSTNNSCAVLATASNRAFGWAQNNDLSLAKMNALQQCSIRGPYCQVRHSVCSS